MTKEELVLRLEALKRSDVGEIVKKKMEEFRSFSEKPDEEWFSELCFCILTANSSAKVGIKVQMGLGWEGFLNLPRKSLIKKLKELGYRFYNRRAEYIIEARKFWKIKNLLKDFKKAEDAREWLVEKIRGLGYKEASHFLRNVGYTNNLAILDRHVLKTLYEYKLVSKLPKNLTRKTYLNLEMILRKFAKEACLTVAELDLYLWYLKTGTVLK
mgnify:CR=1 FL=1